MKERLNERVEREEGMRSLYIYANHSCTSLFSLSLAYFFLLLLSPSISDFCLVVWDVRKRVALNTIPIFNDIKEIFSDIVYIPNTQEVGDVGDWEER